MKKISCLRTVKNSIITPINNSVVCFHYHSYFSYVLARSSPATQTLHRCKIKVFAEQIMMCTGSQQRSIKNVSLTKLGVPKLSLAMYPFSILIDERVPLKQCFSNFLFHRPPYTLDTSFAPPKPDKAHTK